MGGTNSFGGRIRPKASDCMWMMVGRREIAFCMDLFFIVAFVIPGSVTPNVILETGDAVVCFFFFKGRA